MIFDDWVRRDVGQVYVQMFDVALAAWSGESPGLCVFEETCGLAMALEHNGDAYSCDHFVEPKHFLGNINTIPLSEIVVTDRHTSLGRRSQIRSRATAANAWFDLPATAVVLKTVSSLPDGEFGLNYLCEGYKAFFTHVDEPMQFMANDLNIGVRQPT